MTYQNPQILYFLFAIAIPIIIHLFNFRKHKVVYFSSIRFLKEINEEKKAVSTIKQYLILLSRILALAAIVLAFHTGGIFETNFYDSEVAMLLYFIMALPFTGNQNNPKATSKV